MQNQPEYCAEKVPLECDENVKREVIRKGPISETWRCGGGMEALGACVKLQKLKGHDGEAFPVVG